MTKKIKNTALTLSSVAAGLLNALIGAGGGIILSFCLNKYFADDFEDKRNIYVNSQASMIPGCALSCAIYSAGGTLKLSAIPAIAIPAVIGGVLGSILLPRIKVRWLKTAFALLVVWSGYRMLTS